MSAADENKFDQAAKAVTVDIPASIEALRNALIEQREYTLGLYADLPARFWEPARFPYSPIVNPPLWELAHIAWFAEFFCLRWREDDVDGARTPSILKEADTLFNSQTVEHRARWSNQYPDIECCFRYVRESLASVVDALKDASANDLYAFQLALVHEDMHAEALAMTLMTLGLPLPDMVKARRRSSFVSGDLEFGGGVFARGASARSFRFDNESPVLDDTVAPFLIASRPVTTGEFLEFADTVCYEDNRFWSTSGLEWRNRQPSRRHRKENLPAADFAAMHVSYFEAEAWCAWAGRRLPTEAEWEFAALRSPQFFASTGDVWEWCASAFAPYPGFSAARYRDYSEPWFHTHQVLKGGSFATHPRLKYPQYRNFYTRDRCDMFCGFRSCAIT